MLLRPVDTFVVEELNETHRFARLRPEGGTGLVHSGLFPEQEDGALSPLRLQRGDRVAGVRRGQTVTQVHWLERAAPPEELVGRMRALLERLAALGLAVELAPEALADHQWREGPGSPLLGAIGARLRLFFGETHPFEDAGLLARIGEATAEHLPGFSVQPVTGGARFQVQPGGQLLAGGEPDWEEPTRLFEPLVEHLNEALGRAKAPVRWMPVRDNWVLATPELTELLVSNAILQGRASA